MKNSELVMGIDTHHLFIDPDFRFSGFMPNGQLVCRHWRKIKKHASFRYRGHCENDPEFKQIIPYCVITTGDQIFSYQRLENSGETRLHQQYSIGVGGHITPMPSTISIPDIIHQNMLREITEEVCIEGLDEGRNPSDFADMIGMINWNEEKVGSVHLGLVYHVALPEGCTVEVRETDKLQGALRPILGLTQQPVWETWSALVLDAFSFD